MEPYPIKNWDAQPARESEKEATMIRFKNKRSVFSEPRGLAKMESEHRSQSWSSPHPWGVIGLLADF